MAFNFASEDEAKCIKTVLYEKLEARKQRRLGKLHYACGCHCNYLTIHYYLQLNNAHKSKGRLKSHASHSENMFCLSKKISYIKIK